ncbi:MAG TPA: hypothetical protein VFB62_08545 [Polyangiaceae bacterium]|nr:hypothetical protein [Polyangiaceae bacterium]
MMPYLVDREALLQSVGSKDVRLLRELLDEHEEHMEELDRNDEAAIELGAPGVAEALCDLIEGRAPHRHGVPYHYALELLCQRFGTLLDNGAWYPCGWGFVEELDRKLFEQGVSLSIRELLDGGAPLTLPPPLDFPAVGHLTPEDSRAARGALQAVRREELEVDQWRALTELDGWLSQADTHDQLLVLYFY